jgi:hypothetical protein
MRKVHTDELASVAGDLAVPFLPLPAGLTHHQAVNGHDHAGFLGHQNNLGLSTPSAGCCQWTSGSYPNKLFVFKKRSAGKESINFILHNIYYFGYPPKLLRRDTRIASTNLLKKQALIR